MIIRITFMLFIFTGILFAKNMFILPNEAKLMSSPDMAATILLSIPHGTNIAVSESNGIWFKTEYNNSTGWICKFNLTETDPKKDSVVDALTNTNLKTNARRRASSYSTAATTRGLSNVDETIKTNSDFQALDKMIAKKPSQDAILIFMKEGGLTVK